MIIRDSLVNYFTEFPNLVKDKNFTFKSKTETKYNCIAWAIIRDDVWVAPSEGNLDGVFWPPSVSKGFGLADLEAMFNYYEYAKCDDSSFEDGFMKVALYEKENRWTHAARQLPNGKWASKMGILEDIHHETPIDLEGASYGKVYMIMKRKNSSYRAAKKKLK